MDSLAAKDAGLSFDIHLMSFRNGEVATADRETASAFVDSIEHEIEPEFNAYSLALKDGAEVEMYATGLHTTAEPFKGAMIALRGVSDSICDFIYRFCVASSCVAIPAMESSCVLVPDEAMLEELPLGFTDDFPAVHIKSGADVDAALEGGYAAWAEFRDRMLRDTQSSG